jgi:arabinogalactan oligomer/maltooligosaccharide transport system substrate-binding protein
MDGYGGYIVACKTARSETAPDDVPQADAAASSTRSEHDYLCDPADMGLSNSGAVQGIQLLADLYASEQLFPPALADPSLMHEQSLQLFTSGRAAMLIDGPWILPSLYDSEVDYGVASLPVLPGASRAPRPLTVVHSLVANAQTDHPDQVLDLMAHIADTTSIVALSGALNRPPARRDVLREPQTAHLRNWREQALAGVLLPPLPELDVVWSPWARALAEAIPGLRPAQEALDQAVEQVQTTLGIQEISDKGG